MTESLRIVCTDRKCKGSKSFNFVTINISLFVDILLQMNKSTKIVLDCKYFHSTKDNRKNSFDLK